MARDAHERCSRLREFGKVCERAREGRLAVAFYAEADAAERDEIRFNRARLELENRELRREVERLKHPGGQVLGGPVPEAPLDLGDGPIAQ